ncbi:50S ribosomal protein L11 [Candidatus Collierbacteria bacterium]|nr:50S ribosomal protein L11 [Candidatus Collierbacteria bacterium]
MAKKIKAVLKLNLSAGAATPAPPTGPALGQHGVNIMEFVKQYNDKTAEMRGQTIPALVTIYEDRTFTFVLKTPPVSALIKQAINLKAGSKEPHKTKVGKMTMGEVEEIAKKKMGDMNTTNLQSAMNMVIGTARSMGVDVI